CRNMRRDPRVTLCIDNPGPPYKRAMVRGRAEFVEGDWVDLARRMVLRYLGPEGMDYFEATLDLPRVLVRIRPELVSSWDGGGIEACARIHPWYGDEALALLERAFALGFKGLKLHPVSTLAHPGGEETLQLIRAAAERGAPTLFHCGDEPLATPLTVARAAAACPQATIILGHMGGYFHVDEAIEVAEAYENVVLETSAMPYPSKIAEAVQRIGASRVLYASDGPACSPRIEVEKVRLAELPPEAEALVFAGNAKRILDVVS